MISILIRIGILVAIGVALNVAIWPSISTPFLPAIVTAVQYLYTFNNYFPVDTLMTFFGYALLIEIGFWTVRIFNTIVSFTSGSEAPISDKYVDRNKK